jgi:hypothetical protein
MSDAKYTYEQLVEKIIRARVHLEQARHAEHSRSCPVEDPESYAPCNCGASAKNRVIDSALLELKL